MRYRMKQYTIQVTVLIENSLWTGIFERNDDTGYEVARQIFGSEPTDAELYDFISQNFYLLKFTTSHDFKLVIKRKNPKRIKREVKKLMDKAKKGMSKVTRAQEVLKLELEKNKKMKKTVSKAEKEAKLQEKFSIKQAKKKKKHRGH